MGHFWKNVVELNLRKVKEEFYLVLKIRNGMRKVSGYGLKMIVKTAMEGMREKLKNGIPNGKGAEILVDGRKGNMMVKGQKLYMMQESLKVNSRVMKNGTEQNSTKTEK